MTKTERSTVAPPLAAAGSAANAAPCQWTREAMQALIGLPFPELAYRAQTVHREHFDPAQIQLSTLLSVKTGGCPEDCHYCPQSVRFSTGVASEPLLPLERVVEAARAAKRGGATRFCMGAAWRGPKAKDLKRVAEMVRAVKSLGMETCVSLGLLADGQAEELKAVGLDYYNHNVDTAPDFYGAIISTRTFDDRLATLQRIRKAGINVCCGGIVGMGESRAQRAALVAELANMEPQPESVPINMLVQVPGTPLHGAEPLDCLELVRTIACVRIAIPRAYVRLSAGRMQISDEAQALCFLVGANSIFCGEKLLTTPNPSVDRDAALMAKLGLRAEAHCEGTAPELSARGAGYASAACDGGGL